MLTITCHCGAVHLSLSAQPEFVHACNCTLCRASGAQWAYPAPTEVAITGATTGYTRRDKPEPAAEIHFCACCGTTTHFVLTPATVARFGNTMMGVNLALLEDAALNGVERRYPDGHGWTGEGPFAYVRPAELLGARPAGE